MIHIDLGDEVDGPGPRAGRRHGKWHWTCARHSLSGYSKQPLLDACRELKRMGANTRATVGLFRKGRFDTEGRPTPDSTCTVGEGAATTVTEPDRGRIRFVKWKPNPLFEGVPNENKGEI